jgi:hypothetical protein
MNTISMPPPAIRKAEKPKELAAPYGKPETGYRTLAERYRAAKSPQNKNRIRSQILKKLGAERIGFLFLNMEKREAQIQEICECITPEIINGGNMPFLSWFHHHKVMPNNNQLKGLLIPQRSFPNKTSPNKNPAQSMPTFHIVKQRQLPITQKASIHFDIQPEKINTEQNRNLIITGLRQASKQFLKSNPELVLEAFAREAAPPEWADTPWLIKTLSAGPTHVQEKATWTIAGDPKTALKIMASKTPFGERVALELGSRI